SHTLAGTLAVGSGPVADVFAAASGAVYTTNYFAGSLSVLAPVASVTFNETGLPLGTPWSVTLEGCYESATGRAIFFSEPNNSALSYAIPAVQGYSATPEFGAVGLNGTPETVPIAFAYVGASPPVTYAVTFSQLGLATGADWTVTVNGTPELGLGGSAITFLLRNSSGYAYTVTGPAGYLTRPSGGSVSVEGAPVAVPVAFRPAPTRYAVTFNETGLPAGDWWSVEFDGVFVNGTGASAAFESLNGTNLPFAITTNATGASASPSDGELNVSGGPLDVAIVFTTPSTTYGVAFVESGLTSGTAWSVTFNGTTKSSVSSSIRFNATDGLYTFSIPSTGGFSPNVSGAQLHVHGAAVRVEVGFAPTRSPTGAGWPPLGTLSVLAIGLAALLVVAAIGLASWRRRRDRAPEAARARTGSRRWAVPGRIAEPWFSRTGAAVVAGPSGRPYRPGLLSGSN
ncbi:MAG: hypothetical protein L3J91_05915, partial [Thermoplasmata archaeon]|nr:hypothetical protein [Thermoplasmata archaeon]